jgi:hypothetical protein
MRKPTLFRAIASFVVATLPLLASASARADLPAGYAGKPFDPATAGGKGIIPATVKAGPYAIPGRLDFVNYDIGGDGITFHAGDKDLMKAGYGYRTDHPAATISKTSMAENDVWYMSGTSMDGMQYPSATTTDFYLGAIQVNDWFDFTVNVQTAGTYLLSSTWSSGNGPPGGEGGDGSMGLEVFVNDTKVATWAAGFPNFATKANFHNWIPYPNFAMITLQAGTWLIKLQSTTKHLNLDYVDFELAGADGGAVAVPDAGTNSGASSGGGSTGSMSASGASGAISGASAGTSGASSSGTLATTGSVSTGATSSGDQTATSGSTVSTGTTGGGTTGTAAASSGMTQSVSGAVGTSAPASSSGKGCAVAGPTPSAPGGFALLFGLGSVFLARRAKRRISA